MVELETSGENLLAPILVLGISRRSGTNLVAALLRCHPDCAEPGPPLAEDHLLRESHHLDDLAVAVRRHWLPRWGPAEDTTDELVGQLGSGLARFLAARAPGRRVVSKTPSLDGIDHFTRLFPDDVKAVVVVRDGRDTVASLVRGFRYSHERAIREWRRGARALLALQSRTGWEKRVTVVRYEDLAETSRPGLDELLDFVGLDRDRFDRSAAETLPVLGSSFASDRPGDVTWDETAASGASARATGDRSLSETQQRRFAWLAGEEQRALGYPVGSDEHDRSGRVTQGLLDAMWPIRHPDPVLYAKRAAWWVRDRIVGQDQDDESAEGSNRA